MKITTNANILIITVKELQEIADKILIHSINVYDWLATPKGEFKECILNFNKIIDDKPNATICKLIKYCLSLYPNKTFIDYIHIKI